ncbi:MAG: hypothetical protein ABS939_08105, partial [Psychrobacillus sp.]
MKFTKIKKYTLIFVSVIVIVGTGFLFNVTQTNRQFMSENDVRSQLEQLYDAEVTDITLKENVYKAVITKGGSVYLVEVNSTNGDIYTMEQTNEYMLTGISQPVEQSEFATYSDTFEVREYPLTSNIRKKETNNNIVVEMSPITQIQVKEDSMSMVNKVETAQATEMKLIKSSISATSSIQEKLSDSKVDKPITEVIKNAIKDVLKTEPVKTEEVKKEPVKVEVAKSDEGKADAKAEATVDSIEGIKTDSSKTEPTKTDISKTETKNETSKVEPVKVESTKTETSKTEEPKKEEAKKEEPDASSTSNNKTQTETKKPDEAKQESTATVLITP